MRGLCVLFFVLIITLMSCDGHDRKHKTNAEVLKENKLYNSFSEEIKYIPEQYTEVITDTILNTGFQVKIKYYSLDDDYTTKVIKPSKHSNKTRHFKNFEAQIQISKNNTLVTQNIINKELFHKFESASFWNEAIMQFVWVDYENSSTDFILLNTSFNIPETDIYKDFSIIIDTFGAVKIKEINLLENVL